jgi:hypothetical protein
VRISLCKACCQLNLWAGTIVMSVKPRVVVLSNQYLDSHCTSCCSPATSNGLKRCTLCQVVWYCDAVRISQLVSLLNIFKVVHQVCQNKDWSIHKPECTALQKWASSAPSSDLAIPTEAVRCLGRIVWMQQKKGLESAWVRDGRCLWLDAS